MAQPIGISLVLKENLVDRLTKTLPLLDRMEKTFQTMNKTLSNLETSQKRVDNNFKNIGRSVDMVSSKERGLRNLNTGIQGLGSAAGNAQGMMKGLGATVDALMLRVLPLIVAMKGMQALSAAAGEGLDFQNTTTALKNTGFSPAMSNKIIQRSIDLAAQGDSVLSPKQLTEAARGSKAFFGTEQDVYDALPEYKRVAGRARRAGVAMEQPEILGRIWELMNKNVGPVKDRVQFDNQLLAVMSGTGVTSQQLLYQMSVAGGSLAGSDPIDALRTLAYMTKESGAGIAGAGGGGRGRAGQRFAAIKDLARGQMPVAVAKTLYESGYMPGLGKYLESNGSTSTSTMVFDPTGMHRMGRHGKQSHITKGALNKFFMQNAPIWARQGQEDTGAITTMLLDVAAKAKGFKGDESHRLQQFNKLGTGEQAQALGSIGLNRQVSMAIVQLVAGKFKTSVDNFQKAIDDALKQQQKDTPKSIEQMWEELGNQTKALVDKLAIMPDVVNAATTGIKLLSDGVSNLNTNLAPIVQWLTGQTTAEKNINPGHLLDTSELHAKHHPLSGYNTGDLSHDVTRIGKAFERVGHQAMNFLVPPPPPASISPSIANHVMGPSDFMSWTNGKQQEWMVQHPPDMSLITAGKQVSGDIHFHATQPIMLDGKKIGEHVSHHVEKKQSKTALKQSYAGSQAGGSYTSQPHNEGGGQSN